MQLDNRNTVWAVRPELAPLVAAALRGDYHLLRPQAVNLLGFTPTDQQLAEAAKSNDGGVFSSALADAQTDAKGKTETGIAVIPLEGLITPRPSLISLLMGGGGGLEAFRASLRAAVASDQVSAIALNVDSPGGSVDLIPETAAEIRAARTKKPVTAIVNTTAASAAYWLASQATEMVVTPSGAVGSIGTFAIHQDLTGAAEQEGVTLTLVSAGKFKTEGHPFEPLSDDARAHMQSVVDDFHGMFVRDVAKGRGAPVDTVRSGFGEGRMVLARHAIDEGMADRIDTYEGALVEAHKASAHTQLPSPRAAEEPQHEDNSQPNPSGEEAATRTRLLLPSPPRH